jgi:hypothetical protein
MESWKWILILILGSLAALYLLYRRLRKKPRQDILAELLLISIVALFSALRNDLPSEYYLVLRFLVCVVCIYAAYIAYSFKRIGWTATTLIIALIFNPFIKLYFSMALWHIIDVIVAIIFLILVFTLDKQFSSSRRLP